VRRGVRQVEEERLRRAFGLLTLEKVERVLSDQVGGVALAVDRLAAFEIDFEIGEFDVVEVIDVAAEKTGELVEALLEWRDAGPCRTRPDANVLAAPSKLGNRVECLPHLVRGKLMLAARTTENTEVQRNSGLKLTQKGNTQAGFTGEAFDMCGLMCEYPHMATNLNLDPDLLNKALELSGEKTKRAAVTKALQEFIAKREQTAIRELFGKLEWNEDFDLKAERSRL